MIRLFIAFGEWLKFENVLSGNYILLIIMINSNYDNNSCWTKVKKLDHLIILFFFISPTKDGNINDNWTYFLFHYTFFLPEFKLFMHLSSTQKGYKLMRIYIPELGFSSRDFGRKYHNLYSTIPCLMRPIFRTPFNGRYRQVWLYIYRYSQTCLMWPSKGTLK